MDPIGNPPIPWPAVVIGKLAMLFCILFFFARSFGITTLDGGAITETLGFISLGKSVSVGLSREKTELKTHGVYRMTRNPLYAGGFLICAGSCLYAMHPINLLFFAITVFVHHSIILKEEAYLEENFGQQWRDYKNRTPRYFGMARK